MPKYNTLIEYDGEQHFKPIKFFGGEEEFLIRQKHDSIKNDYCKKNNILLIRISYLDNIESKLNDSLFI